MNWALKFSFWLSVVTIPMIYLISKDRAKLALRLLAVGVGLLGAVLVFWAAREIQEVARIKEHGFYNGGVPGYEASVWGIPFLIGAIAHLFFETKRSAIFFGILLAAGSLFIFTYGGILRITIQVLVKGPGQIGWAPYLSGPLVISIPLIWSALAFWGSKRLAPSNHAPEPTAAQRKA